MRTFTLSEKLSLNFISLCLVSVIAVGFYSYYSAKNALMSRTYQQLTSVRIEKQTQLEQYFHERIADFNLAYQVLLETEKGKASRLFLGDILQSISKKERSVKAFGVFSLNKRDEAKLLFKTGRARISFSGIERNIRNSRNRFKYAGLDSARLIDYQQYGDSSFLAVVRQLPGSNSQYVIMLLSAESINKVMLEDNFNRGLGSTGEAYLVGSDSLMRSQSRFIGNSFLTTKVVTHSALSALSGKSGTILTPDYRKVVVMSSYGQVEKSGIQWGIMAEIDQDEAMKQIVSLRNDILLMSLAISLFILAVVLIVAHRISIPLAQLKNAIGKVGDGNLNLQLPIESNDEIGQLTQSFNDMAKKLSDQQANLTEHEARLKHFYDATKEGIILHNNSQLLEVNRAFKNLSGYRGADIMHLKITDLISDYTRADDLENSEQATEDVILNKKDGSQLEVEVQTGTISILDQAVAVTVIRDISERKKNEKILREERQRQLRYVIDGQEQERQRLSRELHDGIGQQLIATKLMLELVESDSEEREAIVSSVKSEINRLIDDVRRISNNLMPSVLMELDLATALQNLCNGFSLCKGESITCSISDLPEMLSSRQKNYIFRIVQEALTNAIKHSEATGIKVSASVENEAINIHIEDNGKGFDPTKITSPGNGMINMRERANLLGGHLYLRSIPGKGSDIYVSIPLLSSNDNLT